MPRKKGRRNAPLLYSCRIPGTIRFNSKNFAVTQIIGRCLAFDVSPRGHSLLRGSMFGVHRVGRSLLRGSVFHELEDGR